MTRRLLALLALILFGCSAAYGQGIIIPDDCRRCPPPPRPIPRPMPLPRVLNIKSVKITTRIEAQVATTKVEQVFENDTPTGWRLYFFPILKARQFRLRHLRRRNADGGGRLLRKTKRDGSTTRSCDGKLIQGQ